MEQWVDSMKDNVSMMWAVNNGLWRFNSPDYADYLTKIKQYTLNGIVQNITCWTLVVDVEDEMSFLKGQAKKFYDLLQAPKDYLLFTKEEMAQAHCQVGALMIANEKIFNWLDNILLKR
jgi:hypothetical protein